MFAKMGKSIHRALGEKAVFNDVLSNPVDCRIIVEHDVALRPDGADYEIIEAGITIDALYEEVGSPKIGTTFETGSTKYTVKRIEENDRVFVKMVVVEDED